MGSPQDFIEEYRITWERVYRAPGEVNSLAPFFYVPCIIVGADGIVSSLGGDAEVRAFLRSRLDSFLDGGVVSARVWGVENRALADYAAQLAVNWELRRGDESVERTYRICYDLIRDRQKWKILLSIYQGGS